MNVSSQQYDIASHCMGLGELLSVLGIDSDLDIPITGLAEDSRKVEDNNLFIAYPGEQHDGRQYLQQAEAAGASAIVYESIDCELSYQPDLPCVGVPNLRQNVGTLANVFFQKPSDRLKLIGVTGTNGKTTCAYLLSQAFQKLGKSSAMMGTIGIGSTDNLKKQALTTGDTVSIYRNLKQFIDQGCEVVCMEVSSHGLDQGRVNALNFDVALFTNLTQDHLDYHKTMQAYGEAKARLFRFENLGCAILNADDPFSSNLSKSHKAASLITYGTAKADLKAISWQCDINGTTLVVEWKSQRAEIVSPLLGEINISNLLATAATLLSLGMDLNEVCTCLGECVSPPGRMQRFKGGNTPTIVVDYSHTPDSLERALKSLKKLCKGETWCVFGCGGDRDKGKRPLMGQVASEWSDRIIVTNDNPRTEDPEQIAREVMVGISIQAQTILDRKQAIECAVAEAGVDDVVLVAGKGHEETQTIGDEVLQLSDRQIAAALVGGVN